MSNYFQRPEDLTSKGFTQAQDLSNNILKPAGDLIPNSDNGYLKPAGDISQSERNSVEEINKYLQEIQTGQKTYGPVLGGAKMFVSLDELKQMVNDGYNIVSANYFEQIQMVEVEFDIPVRAKTR